MKSQNPSTPTTDDEMALDTALARALPVPAPPAYLAARVRAAIARAGASESLESQHVRLQRERRDGLAELEKGFLRLRRLVFGTLIVRAVAVGSVVTLVLPWLRAAFGSRSVLILAELGGGVGLVVCVCACFGRFILTDPLGRIR